MLCTVLCPDPQAPPTTTAEPPTTTPPGRNCTVCGNEGTRFAFSLPPSAFDLDGELIFSAKQDTDILITYPLLISDAIQVTAGQTYHYRVDGLQYRCTEGIEHKGITITGSEPFSVYLTNADYTHETNPGSTILRPISENIEDVYIVNYLEGSSSSRPHSFYMVVADEANTDVAVYKHDAFGLSLHREFILGINEVFTEDSDQDLTGYFIRASKPVAVYSGHGQAQVPVSIIGLSGSDHFNLQV